MGVRSGSCPLVIGEGFKGNCRDFSIEAASGEFQGSGEVKVAKQDLVGLHHRDLLGLRLFHFHDNLSLIKDLCGGIDECGPCLGVARVFETAPQPRVLLQQDPMSVGRQELNANGQYCDAVLIRLDFTWNSNNHDRTIIVRRVKSSMAFSRGGLGEKKHLSKMPCECWQ